MGTETGRCAHEFLFGTSMLAGYLFKKVFCSATF